MSQEPKVLEEKPIGFIALTAMDTPCGHKGGRLYRHASVARNARYADKVFAVRLSDLKEV
ncbi:hypothetical protein [Pyruvatibacter mobilis]|uniref:hypothetical protein n=1 Tax=Pyruvatibacter mobilis TaxID=1712261 RepID=UPI003BACE070